MFVQHSLQVVGGQVARVCRVEHREGIMDAEVGSAAQPFANKLRVLFNSKVGPEGSQENLAGVLSEVLASAGARLQVVGRTTGQNLGRQGIFGCERLAEVAVKNASVGVVVVPSNE